MLPNARECPYGQEKQVNVVLRIEHRIGRASLALLIALAAFWGAGRVGGGTPVAGAAPDCYAQTGFCIVNPTIGDYFQHRGGVNTFGYPVTQAFRFEGFLTQFFQRRIVQIGPDGSARLLNVLDPGLMPYTQFNGATIPAPDPQLVAAAPPATDQAAVLAFVQAYTPDVWGGRPVHFYQTFLTTVSAQAAFPAGGGDPRLLPGFDLEMWGMPTSFPMVDPSNYNFVYQRFQRGVMQYDASTGLTQGLLLADYLKSIITGRNLPGDLRSQSQGSALYLQYWPGYSDDVRDPHTLPLTDLNGAFFAPLLFNAYGDPPWGPPVLNAMMNECQWEIVQLMYERAGAGYPLAAYQAGVIGQGGSGNSEVTPRDCFLDITGTWPNWTGGPLITESAKSLMVWGVVIPQGDTVYLAPIWYRFLRSAPGE
jgi:hypothetical protein